MLSQKTKVFLLVLFLSLTPLLAWADYGGQKTTFFVDATYDLLKRDQLTATLIRIDPSLYFYLDDTWWQGLSSARQNEVKKNLQDLEGEFEGKIYSVLTNTFGSEWRPGIDKDPHITLLVHPMVSSVGGYTNTGDEYSRLQVPNSNQREMIYLNSEFIGSPLAKSFLAHELMHLISFNQKERQHGISEETWLNEGRAEYAPTFLGYDRPYTSSNLQRRVRDFLQSPSDTLTEWKNEKADYGVLNLFIQYLVDHYGVKILADSLRLKKLGIPSLNEMLNRYGEQADFSQIFTDWTIAVLVDNCSVGPRYCYLNEELKGLQITPALNFLPLSGKSSLALTVMAKNWAGHWYKFVGGKGALKIEFIGFPDLTFRIPYVLQDAKGKMTVGFLMLDSYQQGKILISEFGQNIVSVVIIPSIQSKLVGFNTEEAAYSFFWSASTQEQLTEQEGQQPDTTQTENIQALLKRIAFLEEQLNVLRTQLKTQLTTPPPAAPGGPTTSLGRLVSNLKRDDRGEEVKLLQTWLAKDKKVYPEGLMTGFFGSLTKAAVIRFQEKYRDEILTPLKLSRATGIVGPATRAKLNGLYAP